MGSYELHCKGSVLSRFVNPSYFWNENILVGKWPVIMWLDADRSGFFSLDWDEYLRQYVQV